MLCKCSGKYIDIYFILKITYFLFVIIGVNIVKYFMYWNMVHYQVVLRVCILLYQIKGLWNRPVG